MRTTIPNDEKYKLNFECMLISLGVDYEKKPPTVYRDNYLQYDLDVPSGINHDRITGYAQAMRDVWRMS